MIISPVVAELFHADGQTDTTKLAFAFHNFADMPNNEFTRHAVCNALM